MRQEASWRCRRYVHRGALADRGEPALQVGIGREIQLELWLGHVHPRPGHHVGDAVAWADEVRSGCKLAVEHPHDSRHLTLIGPLQGPADLVGPFRPQHARAVDEIEKDSSSTMRSGTPEKTIEGTATPPCSRASWARRAWSLRSERSQQGTDSEPTHIDRLNELLRNFYREFGLTAKQGRRPCCRCR